MNEQTNLKSLENWVQSVIMHPAGVVAGIATSEARFQLDVSIDEIEKVVARSNGLSAIERLGIYNHAYFARLQECLRAEFPILLHALGEKLFGLFTFDYLLRYPSRSYTLTGLGEHFQQYLTETRPDGDALPENRESWPDFIIDLAVFERAFNEVFDGPGVERQRSLDPNKPVGTTKQMLNARFIPVVCLKLLAFRYPINQYFTAVRNDEDPAFPDPCETFIAMTRKAYIVRLFELTHLQYEVLRALIAGKTLKEILVKFAIVRKHEMKPKTSTVFAWINDWVAKGLFARIDL